MGDNYHYDDDDYSEGHGIDCDCEECTEAYYEDNCGELPPHLGGGCTMAGSEHCDFDCPFRDRVLFGEDDEDDR